MGEKLRALLLQKHICVPVMDPSPRPGPGEMRTPTVGECEVLRRETFHKWGLQALSLFGTPAREDGRSLRSLRLAFQPPSFAAATFRRAPYRRNLTRGEGVALRRSK
ncbi:hypothetical protein AAFF_G00047510 [Aldrovandia affinis]|uniref:Uncharacterized protein n=1 Tax=Aldrovandia affinis TaxID=143900 RepID=A0AAD7S1P8_9TELE|nr:hypothetical protein AAFF_G00047510 [Aldrovandia affinis]